MSLTKEARQIQATTTVTTIDAQFSGTIAGDPANPQPPNSLTSPTGQAIPFVYDTGAPAWSFVRSFTSSGTLAQAFPAGNYTLQFGGRTVPVVFPADDYPSPAVIGFSFPASVSLLTGPGGLSAGPTGFLVNRTAASTLTFSTTWNQTSFVAGSSRVRIRITTVVGAPINFEGTNAPAMTDNRASVQVPASSFAEGAVYRMEFRFERIVATDTSVPGYPITVGFARSQAFNLNIAGSPVFLIQPQNTTIAPGGTATLHSEVGYPANVTYQWQKDGVALNAATGATLTIANAQSSNAGAYSVVATNASGTAASETAIVTVTGPPAIVAHPASHTVTAGSTVVLGVSANGASSYQWRRDGVNIAGANAASLLLAGANTVSGNYTAVVSNAAGSSTSNSARITISNTADVGRLSNLAIRSHAGTGAETLIVGFAVSPGQGTKPLLIRGIGPSLALFGLTEFLADPVATVFQGSTTAATNDNWGGDAAIMAQGTRVGAFSLASGVSLDAALAYSPSPGTYSVQITGKNNATGIALAEIYDASAGSPAPTSPRLINVSARTQVGTGGNILIAGFVIGGATSKTVLIRAVGPALGPFGVGGALADPKLQLFSGTTLLRENDNWSGDAQVAATAANVGAFALADPNSRDSTLLVTLPPGSYTAQISGVSDTTGVALVELYDVP